MSIKPLKLQARDAEDIAIVSAVLQDAIVPVCDMVWQKDEKTFIMIPQRLRRELGEEIKPDRICSAVRIKGVEKIETLRFDPNDKERMLDLLMVAFESDYLHFVFADHIEIRLQLKEWSLWIEDFGEAWPAACTPCHDSPSASRLDGAL